MPEEELEGSPASSTESAENGAGEKPKIKHTVEAQELPAFFVLAAIFDILSGLPTIAGFVIWVVGLITVIAAPISAALGFIIMCTSAIIAIVGHMTFMIIWMVRGVMPWHNKYWSWYLISFLVKWIPGANLIPAYTMLQLRMIAQSRIEDRLARTTGFAQIAVQAAKFKAGQRVRQKTAALKAAGAPKELLKERERMEKALRVLSARTIRRTLSKKITGSETPYQEGPPGAREYDPEMLAAFAREPGFKEALEIAELSGLVGTRPLPAEFTNRNASNRNLDADVESILRTQKGTGGTANNAALSKTQSVRKLTPAEAQQAGLNGQMFKTQSSITNFGPKPPDQRTAEQVQSSRLPLRGQPQPQGVDDKSVSGTRLPTGGLKPAPTTPPPKPPLTNADQTRPDREATLSGRQRSDSGSNAQPRDAKGKGAADATAGVVGRETPGGVAPVEAPQTPDGVTSVGATEGVSEPTASGAAGRVTPGGVVSSSQPQTAGRPEKVGPSDSGTAPAYEKEPPTPVTPGTDRSSLGEPAVGAVQNPANQNFSQRSAPAASSPTSEAVNATQTNSVADQIARSSADRPVATNDTAPRIDAESDDDFNLPS